MTFPSSSMRLRPFRPTPFGRYTLLVPISFGGMGEIYLARLENPLGFEKLCVIKKILPHLSKDPDFIERFTNEAKTLAQLSHGSIAQVMDIGIHQGEPYIALEHVDGKDLRKISGRMRDRSLPVPLTLSLYVMSRVLDALAYAHRKRDEEEREIGLVHRDVSPQNVILSYEGEVKVVDFGLAKSTLNESHTHPSVILGKFLYMSPEQAQHQVVDRRSDLYSVGLCLYELISGNNPFEGCPPAELLAQVSAPQIPPLRAVEPLVPGNVEAVVMKALARDPAQRFQSAEEFRGKLLSCLLQIDSEVGPESASRFMRETFQAEIQQERKLLSSLREHLRQRRRVQAMYPEASPGEMDTAVLSSEVAPLSFTPTPRTKDPSGPQVDGETLPSIVLDQASLSLPPEAEGTGRTELNWSPPTSPAQAPEVAVTRPEVPLELATVPGVSAAALNLPSGLPAPPPEPGSGGEGELGAANPAAGSTLVDLPPAPVEQLHLSPALQELPGKDQLRRPRAPTAELETVSSNRGRVPWPWVALLVAAVLAVGGYVLFDLSQAPGVERKAPRSPEAGGDVLRNPSPSPAVELKMEEPETPAEVLVQPLVLEAPPDKLPPPVSKKAGKVRRRKEQ